jgi:regulator of replication initiation timing
MLAAAMTDSQFADYRERYEMFSKTLKELHAENTKLSSDNKELAERAAQPGITQTEKVTLKLQADMNKERHLKIVEEMQLYKDYMRDVYFMKGIRNDE